MKETVFDILLMTVLPIVLTFLGTLWLNTKSGISKNNDNIEKLSRQLGLSDRKTLSESVTEKFNVISKDIGRNGDASLTKQHAQIEDTISCHFKTIASRYEAEDAAYRHFTMQQRDLKETLDHFSKDYFEHMKNEKALSEKCMLLEQQNEQLLSENKALKQRIRQASKGRGWGDDPIQR